MTTSTHTNSRYAPRDPLRSSVSALCEHLSGYTRTELVGNCPSRDDMIGGESVELENTFQGSITCVVHVINRHSSSMARGCMEEALPSGIRTVSTSETTFLHPKTHMSLMCWQKLLATVAPCCQPCLHQIMNRKSNFAQ